MDNLLMLKCGLGAVSWFVCVCVNVCVSLNNIAAYSLET